MKAGNTYSHTLMGSLWFSFPIALILTFLFHVLVRNSLIENTPSAWLSRISTYRIFNWPLFFLSNYLRISLSVGIGICSHLLLDNVTHPYGYFLRLFPILDEYHHIGFTWIRLYVVFDVMYSFCAAAFYMMLWHSLPANKSIKTSKRSKATFWMISSGLAVCTMGIKQTLKPDVDNIWDLVTLSISSALFGIVLTSVWWRTKRASKA